MKMNKSLVVIVSLVSVFILILSQSGLSGYVGDVSPWYYTPQSTYSYVIGLYNMTHYYLQNGTGYGLAAYEGYEYMSVGDIGALINYAETSFTVDVGGSIYIMPGSYDDSSNITILNRVPTAIYGAGKYLTTINALTNWTVIQITHTSTWTDSNAVTLKDFGI